MDVNNKIKLYKEFAEATMDLKVFVNNSVRILFMKQYCRMWSPINCYFNFDFFNLAYKFQET